MAEKRKQELVGKVASASNDKTITVLVETHKMHKLYGKRVKSSKKFKAHDAEGIAKNGDIVRIMETRPLSKTKHFRVVEVVKKADII